MTLEVQRTVILFYGHRELKNKYNTVKYHGALHLPVNPQLLFL